jgi:TPR repeat protein
MTRFSQLKSQNSFSCIPVSSAAASAVDQADISVEISRLFVPPNLSPHEPDICPDNVAEPRADQGNAQTRFDYGICFDNEQSVRIDYAKYAHYFKRSADHGLAQAQFNHGNCLPNGRSIDHGLKLERCACNQRMASS